MRVLIALDHSEAAIRAAKEAQRLFPGAEFLVINVSRLNMAWLGGGEFGTVYPAVLESMPSGPISDADLARLAAEAGITEATLLAEEGEPARVICAAADEHAVDVVVVGSHDKGAIHRLIDPSVAYAVVQGTHRPVLVVSGTPPTPPTGTTEA